MENPCSHLDWLRMTSPAEGRAPGPPACAACIDQGRAWSQLRMCLTCGYVGCCDNSPNRHASRHFRDTGHPLMRSLEPGERWIWCHLDRLAFIRDDITAR